MQPAKRLRASNEVVCYAVKHRSYQNGASHSGYGGAPNGMRPSSASLPGRDRGMSPAASHAGLGTAHPLNNAHLMHDKPPASQLPPAQLHNAGLKANGSAAGSAAAGNENSMAAVNTGDTHGGANGFHASPHLSAPGHVSGAGTPVPPEGTPAPPRVDGKDFFRQVRCGAGAVLLRLSPVPPNSRSLHLSAAPHHFLSSSS
jgi:hypothetical protein